MAAVSSAVNLFREEPDKWTALQLRGMARDSSWERAAQQYEQVRGREGGASGPGGLLRWGGIQCGQSPCNATCLRCN